MIPEIAQFRNYYQQAKDRAKRDKQFEIERVAEGIRPWPYYTASLEEYQTTFNPVFHEPFSQFINRRRREKGKVFVLNVMGPIGLFPPDVVDGEVAITLNDFRSDEIKAQDSVNNKLVIAEDVCEGTTWKSAKQFLKMHDDTAFPGFDLVVCRPCGLGWRTLRGEQSSGQKENMDFMEWILMQRSYSLVSQYGELLVEMPHSQEYGDWISDINAQPTARAQTTTGNLINTIRITRIGERKSVLPPIKSQRV